MLFTWFHYTCVILYDNSLFPVISPFLYIRKYQQRLPYDLLSGLANALLDGTVFQIVQGLKEVQVWEERAMSQQRIKMVADHKGKQIDFIN